MHEMSEDVSRMGDTQSSGNVSVLNLTSDTIAGVAYLWAAYPAAASQPMSETVFAKFEQK